MQQFLTYGPVGLFALIIVLGILIAIRIAAVKSPRNKQLDQLLNEAKSLNLERSRLLGFESGYLTKEDWTVLQGYIDRLKERISEVPFLVRKLHSNSKDIRDFLEISMEESQRVERNARYVDSELALTSDLLSDIDGKQLDDQQRLAVIVDEKSNLIIAGAGSGKTLTLVGKVKYLVERWRIDPERILVTSFTKKSVKEIAERIERAGIENVSCKTFHSIGYSYLDDVTLTNDNTLENCIREYLKSSVPHCGRQIQAFLEFYGCFAHLPKDYSDYGVDGKRMEDLRAVDLKTIKGKLEEVAAAKSERLDTLHGEKVRSLEELMIANYLFIHGIRYEYEKKYTGDIGEGHKKYQPDFYLVDYDIWLEHFGIDENGRVPWIANQIEEKRYIEGIGWKRNAHSANGTKLIESYSYWNKDHDLINKLQQLLTENGVSINEEPERLARLYSELNEDDKYLTEIVKLVSSFLSLAKANNVSMDEIWERARSHYEGDGYMWHRFELFMAFAEPIMSYYKQRLLSSGEIDYDDMINMATERILADGLVESYDYIIVDEYQDISKSRFGLIQAIRGLSNAKLICVGDDWQSIYRFAGSDVTLFTNFSKYVGFHETLKIETTYRNSQELVDAASRFIEANPAQIRKELKSVKTIEEPIRVFSSSDMRRFFEAALDSILASRKGYSGHILVLGRHNFDLETLYPDLADSDSIRFKKNKKTGETLIDYRGYKNISFLSVHKAKGLEADDVIVLNLVNSRYGFPNRLESDPILELLLDNEDAFEFAEERRLFYVAMTRTKNRAYLITDSLQSAGVSPFVKEIQNDESVGVYVDKDYTDPVKCPKCGTGNLLIKTNSSTGEEFLGCSNHPFCDKTYSHIEILDDRMICPQCGGWMIRRTRKSDGKPFFGCSNWRKSGISCNATVDIEEAQVDYEVLPF